MSETEAREILRAVFGRVSAKYNPVWLTPDVVKGDIVKFHDERGYKFSKVEEVTVCRHDDWKTLCDDCDWITEEMRENSLTFEEAQVKRADISAEIDKEKRRLEERQAVEEAENERDTLDEAEVIAREQADAAAWAATVKAAEDEYYAVVVETPQTGEVEKVIKVIKDEYRARQQDSFNRIGGGPTGWYACEIEDILPNGQVIYMIHKDYIVVMPYTDTFGPREEGLQCELCGHWIIYRHPIENDKLRRRMDVGSECVDNFMGAGYVTKQVKKFRETKLRVAYGEWRQTGIAECNKRSEHGTWLEYPYWKFRSKLEKSLPENMSARKIVNIFKKAKELAIPIPEGILTEPKTEEAGEET